MRARRCIAVWGCLAAAALTGAAAHAQGTAADYRRAQSLRKTVKGKVTGLELTSAWSTDGKLLAFQRFLPGKGHEYVRLDVATGRELPAFDHSALARLTRDGSEADLDPARLPVSSFTFDDAETLWLLLSVGKATRAARIGTGGAPEMVPLTDAPVFRLEALPPAREAASRDGGPEMTLIVANRTTDPIQLFWVDRGKKRKKYGTVAPDAVRRQHTFSGHAWMATDAEGAPLCFFAAAADRPVVVVDGAVAESEQEGEDAAKKGKRGPRGVASPDGTWRAFVKAHNVHLKNVATGEETRLSADGVAGNGYVGPLHWSPDGRRLAVIRRQDAEERKVHVVEAGPSDQLQPKLHEFNYRKPGDSLPHPRPCLFDVETRKAIPVDDTLFPTPWALNHFHWLPDSSRFLFLYNQRGHQVLRLIALDAATGEASVLVDETSDTFICYSSKTFLRYLDATSEAIWMSERDGWNHLYLIDLMTGAVKNRITNGQWVVRGVQKVDEEKRELLLRVLGVHAGQDPYYVHVARVAFDGSGFTLLTEGNGTHEIEFSPDGTHYVDSWSRVDLPGVKELRRTADGTRIAELTRADWSELLDTGWAAPEPFVAKGRDGKTDIHGVIYRPTDLDPARKYPVIEAIYAGPHGQHVPKGFAEFRGTQALAELGFVVVQIDGMGTNWRSKAFQDVCWKNLGDAGFPDRIAWIKAAAAKYPYIDATRVGVYGGSAGGQNAMRALIAHHEFYSVAVADCGCHDNRMDKIWWNEQWMGWPIDEAAYDRSSNVKQAHRLKGHLQLTVGALDRNVDPASTLQVVQALIDADIDFDLVVFPNKGHGAGGSPYGERRRNDFFVRHLLGTEPRAE